MYINILYDTYDIIHICKLLLYKLNNISVMIY